MTKVGILDDEVIICETLNKYLLELGYDVPDYAMSYDEAVELCNNHKPDIMLLDININGEKNGIDFAKFLRQNHNIPLIFVSSYSDKTTVEQAKEAKPNGYLVKPFSKNDLFAAIEVALSNFSIQSKEEENTLEKNFKLLTDAIFIKQDSLYIKVYFKDVLYVKSEGVYAEIFTKEKKYLIRETLKNLLEILPSDSFFHIHRSYIVNINFVTAVNTEYVVVEKETIPMSRTSREEFLKRLNLL